MPEYGSFILRQENLTGLIMEQRYQDLKKRYPGALLERHGGLRAPGAGRPVRKQTARPVLRRKLFSGSCPAVKPAALHSFFLIHSRKFARRQVGGTR